MKAADFWRTCEGQMPDAPGADVVVIDEDGFVHVTEKIYWSAEDAQWVVKTRWQSHTEEKQDDRGYPAQ